VVSPRWSGQPLSGVGAARRGGRWNAPGIPSLYLSENHATAIAEYNQDLEHPGTLIPFDLSSDLIVDLTDAAVRAACTVDQESLYSPWKHLAYIERGQPPGWEISRSLAAAGADGLRVPSAQIDGVNIVLWRWNEQSTTKLAAVDPFGDLSGH